MKRWIVLAAFLAVILALPQRQGDVADLLPVELVYVYKEGNLLRVETDTGQFGEGATLAQALEELRATAPGEVFLDTADYLILTRDTVECLPQLADLLRPGTQVCLGFQADAQAAAYLAAHKPGVTLKDCRSGAVALPTLVKREERYSLVS